MQLAQSASAGAFGNEGPFVLGHGATDLQEQLVVRVLTHGTVEELDMAAVFLEFFEQEHLMDIVTGQTIRVGHPDGVELRGRGVVAQPVQAGPAQGRAPVAVVAEDMGLRQVPPLGGDVGAQSFDLLINGLGLCLQPGRDPDLDRYTHG